MVLLHGRGADEDDLLGLLPWLPRRYLYVSLRAPRHFAGGGYAWFEHNETGRPELASFQESLAALHAFLSHLPEELGADRARLALVGFSQGAAMAAALALSGAPARSVAVLSGFLPDSSPVPARTPLTAPPQAFVAHGVDDPLLPLAAGREIRDRLQAVGTDVTYREYPMGHTIGEDEVEDLAQWLTASLAAPAEPSPDSAAGRGNQAGDGDA